MPRRRGGKRNRDRDRLLAAVRERVNWFAATQDPREILARDAVDEVAALLGAVADPAADLEVRHAAGLLHWCRYLVLPEGQDQQDLAMAVRLLHPVYQAYPGSVPEPLQHVLGADNAHTGGPGDDTLAAWHNTAVALLAEAQHSGDPVTLDQAVDLFRRAVAAAPEGHPRRAAMLSDLGNGLRLRYECGGDEGVLAEARRVFRLAASCEDAPATIRVRAARGWGACAALAEDWAEAGEAFAVAIGLLPRMAPRRLLRGDREYGLSRLAGLASDAAACALWQGDAATALRWLEQGRGVLLSQALDTRSDLTELRRRAPGLADRFVWLRDELDRSDLTPTGITPAASTTVVGEAWPDPVSASRRAVERRRRLVEEWERLISDIRAIPGLEDFLRPPRWKTCSPKPTRGRWSWSTSATTAATP